VPPISEELGARSEKSQRSKISDPNNGNDPERLVRGNDPTRQEERADKWNEYW